MEHLPLTSPGPWTEIPAGMETLFPEIAPSRYRQVHVTVTVPGRCLPVMDVVTSMADRADVFLMAFDACENWDEFTVTAERFRG